MLDGLRDLLKDSKLVLSNLASLISFQAVNYILPLITLPYLVRILGVEVFGLISFSLALTTYVQIIVDYGFNLTATRNITQAETDTQRARIFYSTIFSKLLLFIISGILFIILVLSLTELRLNMKLHMLYFSSSFGLLLLPSWYFQGIQKMKLLAFINFSSKLFFTLLIFVLVKEVKDYELVPAIFSSGNLFAGFYGFFMVARKSKFEASFLNISLIRLNLRDGWHIFLANLSSSLYTITTTVILGFFSTKLAVGYYSLGFKLINAFKSLNGPISQALYPYIIQKAKKSMMLALSTNKKWVIWIGSIMLLFSLFLLFGASFILETIFGVNAKGNSVLVIQIMSIIPFLVSLDTFMGTLTLIVFNYKKEFSQVIMFAGIFNVIVGTIFILFLDYVGAALSVLLTEIFITIFLYVLIERNGLNFFKKLSIK